MHVLFAADGSDYTKKALAFLVTHESMLGPDDQLSVLHVVAPLPPRVKALVGSTAVHSYQTEEAEHVLGPIRHFLDRHALRFDARWTVGHAADEILAAAKAQHAHLIVMGTHGHGIIGRALMGSVAQKVVVGADIPVLLVK